MSNFAFHYRKVELMNLYYINSMSFQLIIQNDSGIVKEIQL